MPVTVNKYNMNKKNANDDKSLNRWPYTVYYCSKKDTFMLCDDFSHADMWQHRRIVSFLAVRYWPMSDCRVNSFASSLWSLVPASEAGGAQIDSESTATDGVRRVRWSITIIMYRNSRQRSRRVGANRSRHIDDARRRRIVRWRQLRIRSGATHDCAFDTATSTAHRFNSSTISRSVSRPQSLYNYQSFHFSTLICAISTSKA